MMRASRSAALTRRRAAFGEEQGLAAARRRHPVSAVAWLAAALVLIAADPAPAQEADGRPARSTADDRPHVRAARAAAGVRVDGALDEADWARAEPIADFRLINLREGQTPAESTEVRVLFDVTRIYFGIRCDNAGPGAVRASLAPHDDILDGDHISIHLDTYRDRRRAYIFGVNPYGVQLDGILDGGEPDFSWDGIWEAEARRGERGWTAEIAIPLRTLRFPSGGGGAWGIWVRREITKADEVCSWPLYRLSVQGAIMLQAADLEGLDGLTPGGRLEIRPYAASTWFGERTPDAGGALSDWSDHSDGDVGLDLKAAVTTTLAADLTVNPDFSQIEADALQIDVNQRFPLFFPEKRPFFLEGAEAFNMPYRLVYTRRMANPSSGVKLAGQIGKWSVNTIGLRDDGGGSGSGIGANEDGGPYGKGWFGVGRARYDMGGKAHVGFLWTDHTTSAAADPAGGAGRNVVAGVDARALIGNRWTFDSQVARSETRPDSAGAASYADWLSAFAGWYNDGTFYAIAWHDDIGPDFRAETGFLERVDARFSGLESNYTFRPESRWLRAWQPQANLNLIHDHEGVIQERRAAAAIEWTFQKQTRMHTRHAHVIERWQGKDYYRRRYIFELDNSAWRPLSFEFDATLEDGIYYEGGDSASFLGWQENYELVATARPSSRVTAETSVTRSRFTYERGGAEVYDLWLAGCKVTVQFTRELYARLYPQYDSGDSHLDLDALLGYVLHPGSVLYLGVNADVDRIDDRRHATGRTLFCKVSYAFQR